MFLSALASPASVIVICTTEQQIPFNNYKTVRRITKLQDAGTLSESVCPLPVVFCVLKLPPSFSRCNYSTQYLTIENISAL